MLNTTELRTPTLIPKSGHREQKCTGDVYDRLLWSCKNPDCKYEYKTKNTHSTFHPLVDCIFGGHIENMRGCWVNSNRASEFDTSKSKYIYPRLMSLAMITAMTPGRRQ